ncbi:hypothetical protein GCM10025770_36730 [Viridibacterium curvum]|uniref:Uncharacterized protein n=1 Tax=Viridibacterium curvum TaxID=1101404 RepID=A0ABP9R4N8_9RHOO
MPFCALLETELLARELLDFDEDDEDAAVELLDFDELDDATALLAVLEELPVAAEPTEHQALVVKLLVGNAEPVQAKLPVLTAYTNSPDLPSATLLVPLMVQVAPVFCAHLVYPLG